MFKERAELSRLPSSVLLAEDDASLSVTFSRELTRLGCCVQAVHSLHALRYEALSGNYDFGLLDVCLEGGSSIEVAKEMLCEGRQLPTVMFSAWWDIELAHEAGVLGVLEAIEKPLWSGHLEAILTRNWAKVRVAGHGRRQCECPIVVGPRSNADRFVLAIQKIIDHDDGDVKTVRMAAEVAGMSESSFEELCMILQILPQDARDFARMLRVVIRSEGNPRVMEALLMASDKTLERLFRAASIRRNGPPGSTSIDDFLDRQTFIDDSSSVVVVPLLRRCLAYEKPSKEGNLHAERFRR